MGQLGKLLRCFRCDDTGAVTIDWVALTSGILLLGIMVVYSIFNVGVSSLVSNVGSTLLAVNVVECKSNASLTGINNSVGRSCSVKTQ